MVVHLERDVIDACPTRAKRAAAGRVLHAVFDEEDPARVRADAGRIMEGAEADALAYLDFPEAHRRRIRTNNVWERRDRIRTNNVWERRDREIKRRTRVVKSFPSEAELVRPARDVLRGLRGPVQPQLNGPRGDRGAVGEGRGARPRPDGRAAGEGEDRRTLRA